MSSAWKVVDFLGLFMGRSLLISDEARDDDELDDDQDEPEFVEKELLESLLLLFACKSCIMVY